MSAYRLYPFLFSLAFLFFSCSKKERCGCFDSNGEIVIESRNLSSFNELEIADVFEVNLHLKRNPHIEIKTGQHLLKGIETKIENSRLIINNKNICNWSRKFIGKISLDIFCDSLTYIKLSESCDLVCKDTVNTNKFTIDNYADISKVNMTFNCSVLTFAVHAGTGEMNIKGKVSICYLWTMGYSKLNLTNLKTDYCYMNSNSTGNSYIHVNKELEATLQNSGNIYYSGNPYMIKAIEKGKGRLVKIN